MYEKIEQPSSKAFTTCLKIINLIAAYCLILTKRCGNSDRSHWNCFYVRPQSDKFEVFAYLKPDLSHVSFAKQRLFGFMMVAAEFKIKFLLRECHFLTHLLGRGIFFL